LLIVQLYTTYSQIGSDGIICRAMFIDEGIITVQSGKGGDGVVHFRREKYIPRGGPDGGDGGKGGDVVLRVELTLNTLSTFRYQTRFMAEAGSRGAKQNMTGRSGKHLTIPVPPGTIVYDNQTGEVIGDLTGAEQTLVVAMGGRGGRGNARFANSRDQAPRHAERGEPAQIRELRLELKLIADVGIVGIPNAGKSTLLSVVTNARPKIAPYPFTTLEPNLGIANLDEDTTLVLADIPGLIEGAHLGVGLGHDFLRHIQRTRILIHLLDGLSEDPVSDYTQINSELALFDPRLAEKPQVVVMNKIDIPEVKERVPSVAKALKKIGLQDPEGFMAISAVTGENVRPMMFRVYQRLQATPALEQMEEVPVYRHETDPTEFTITNEEGVWRVQGQAIERAAAMTYWEYDASVRRFQRILQTLGVEAALRKAGVQEGETVMIGTYELEWSD
jgi:GTP-binding protein